MDLMGCFILVGPKLYKIALVVDNGKNVWYQKLPNQELIGIWLLLMILVF